MVRDARKGALLTMRDKWEFKMTGAETLDVAREAIWTIVVVSSRPACGAAQPAMTALNAVSTVTAKASERTVRARRVEM